jgi:DNA-binding GntR family transcriptional regulator
VDPPDHLHTNPGDRLVFRRGKLREREDDEVRMLKEALANVDDIPRVKRILLELGRFYNPVTNRPFLDLDTRRRVVTLLEAGDPDGARAVLETHLSEYLKMDDRRHAAPPG